MEIKDILYINLNIKDGLGMNLQIAKEDDARRSTDIIYRV